MNEAWGLAGTLIGTAGAVVGGVFASRASARASEATAEATRAAAAATAEPDQRAADLAAFREIRDVMQRELGEVRAEMGRMRALVRSLSRAYVALWSWVQNPVGDVPEPDELVKDHLRTGV